MSASEGREWCQESATELPKLERQFTMEGKKKWVLIGVGACATYVTLKVARRVVGLLSHHEDICPWLDSVIPPPDYDFKKDTSNTEEIIRREHPELLDIVQHGTLTVLTPPPDYDRAFPDQLYILGTAHVSRKTAAAVYRTIYEVEPDAVVVELCRSRSFMMHREIPPEMYEEAQPPSSSTLPEAQQAQGESGSSTSVTPASQPPAVSRPEPSLSSQLNALVAALQAGTPPFQALLGWTYAKIEAQLGTVAGLEFIRAQHAIQDLQTKHHPDDPPLPPHLQQPGVFIPTRHQCQVYLGDVPLQRTVSRVWGVLSVRQKLNLLCHMLWDLLTFKADDAMLEALMNEDMLDLLQQELGSKYPQILGPLLHERNWQLAYAVHQAAEHGMKKVVLVVGRGHVPGIVYSLLRPFRMRRDKKSFRVPSGGTLALDTS